MVIYSSFSKNCLEMWIFKHENRGAIHNSHIDLIVSKSPNDDIAYKQFGIGIDSPKNFFHNFLKIQLNEIKGPNLI